MRCSSAGISLVICHSRSPVLFRLLQCSVVLCSRAAYVVARPRISRQFDQVALDTFGSAAVDQMYQITGALCFSGLLCSSASFELFASCSLIHPACEVRGLGFRVSAGAVYLLQTEILIWDSSLTVANPCCRLAGYPKDKASPSALIGIIGIRRLPVLWCSLLSLCSP
jgi:hypothetical protein